jgi:hypothetical protein
VIGSRKIPGRKIRPVNWYSIFLPHIFLLLAVGFELPNQYQLIFAAELMFEGQRFVVVTFDLWKERVTRRQQQEN